MRVGYEQLDTTACTEGQGTRSHTYCSVGVETPVQILFNTCTVETTGVLKRIENHFLYVHTANPSFFS